MGSGFAESVYRGPDEVVELEVGGRSIRLARPAEPDRLLDDPDILALNARDDYMPYWAYLWPGAFLLAEQVGRERWAEGTRALEIGCGLGLAGLVGVASGLNVVFSDYDVTPLRFVSRSCQENTFGEDRHSTLLLDWRTLPEDRYPLILGADVLYERRLVPLVANLLARMLEPDGEALVAGPYRVATEDLTGELRAHGLFAEAEPAEARDDRGRIVRGTVHRIHKTH
ncbi:MAG TPA: methyltransferase [Isosphaeraceae bacterium]|nr:methyltransferase [Isosphaeraceae bacterium]